MDHYDDDSPEDDLRLDRVKNSPRAAREILLSRVNVNKGTEHIARIRSDQNHRKTSKLKTLHWRTEEEGTNRGSEGRKSKERDSYRVGANGSASCADAE